MKIELKLKDGNKVLKNVSINNYPSDSEICVLYDKLAKLLLEGNISVSKTDTSTVSDVKVVTLPHRIEPVPIPVSNVTIPAIDGIDIIKGQFPYTVPKSRVFKRVIGEKPKGYDICIDSDEGTRIPTLFITKCPNCGKVKFYKNSPTHVFKCDCEYTIDCKDNLVPVTAAKCPNCGMTMKSTDRLHFTSIRGMDISTVANCKSCSSPLDLKYNEKDECWVGYKV